MKLHYLVLAAILTMLTLFPLSVQASWLICHQPEFKGRIVDIETDKPIEGALIIAFYQKNAFGGPGGEIGSTIHAKEALTDKNGYFWVQSPAKTVFTLPSVLVPNTLRRLGYILTDLTFTYGISETWVHTDQDDPWISTGDHISTTHPGTAVINSDGFYPGMYNMRGKLMWWGAGYVLENLVYAYDWNGPIDDTCSWSVLQ